MQISLKYNFYADDSSEIGLLLPFEQRERTMDASPRSVDRPPHRRDGVAFLPDRSKPRHPASDNGNGMLTVTDKRLLRRAKNALVRVGTLEQLKGIANNAKYFADALDKVLREN